MMAQLVGPAPGTRGRMEESSYTDCYIPSGRIGNLDLTRACFTAIEVFHFAARDLAAQGLDGGVRALLESGRETVRAFLRRAYGCGLGERDYFTPSHLTSAQADAKDFLRILGRAVGARKRARVRP